MYENARELSVDCDYKKKQNTTMFEIEIRVTLLFVVEIGLSMSRTYFCQTLVELNHLHTHHIHTCVKDRMIG